MVAAFIAFQGEQASSRPTPSRTSRKGSQKEPRVPGIAIPWAPELEPQDQS